MPADTEFLILSGDRGLDHVVSMLQREKRTASRVGAARGGVHRDRVRRDREDGQGGRGILRGPAAGPTAAAPAAADAAEQHPLVLQGPPGDRWRGRAERPAPPRAGDRGRPGAGQLCGSRAVESARRVATHRAAGSTASVLSLSGISDRPGHAAHSSFGAMVTPRRLPGPARQAGPTGVGVARLTC